MDERTVTERMYRANKSVEAYLHSNVFLSATGNTLLMIDADGNSQPVYWLRPGLSKRTVKECLDFAKECVGNVLVFYSNDKNIEVDMENTKKIPHQDNPAFHKSKSNSRQFRSILD